MKVKKIYLDGLHCNGFVEILTREFKKIDVVKKVKVFLKGSYADIYYDNKEPNFEKINKVSQQFGYKAYKAYEEKKKLKKNSFNLNEWIISIAIFSSLILIYSIFKKVGFFNGININNSKISYPIALLIGVVASFSKCFAVVGSIVLGFNQSNDYLGNEKGISKVIKPNLIFQVSRILRFFILGGILGLIGRTVNLSGKFIPIFTIFITIILFFLSLNVLEFRLSIFSPVFKPFQKTSSLIESFKKKIRFYNFFTWKFNFLFTMRISSKYAIIFSNNW